MQKNNRAIVVGDVKKSFGKLVALNSLSFDVNNGDQVSIVSNTKNVTVIVLGEALNSGNLDDLIRVKNIRSGRVIKGYIKKNKIIRVFR